MSSLKLTKTASVFSCKIDVFCSLMCYLCQKNVLFFQIHKENLKVFMFKETSISQYLYQVIGIERYFEMKCTFKRQTMTSLLVVTLFYHL